MDGPHYHLHATLENNAAENVAKRTKFVKFTLAFFSKIYVQLFFKVQFYRIFDIAEDVQRLTMIVAAVVQRRFSATELIAKETDAIRITIVINDCKDVGFILVKTMVFVLKNFDNKIIQILEFQLQG